MVNAPKKRIRFERHPSQVVFDPVSSSYVVTWAKCGKSPEERLKLRKDHKSWIPSVSAMAELYDRGMVEHDRIVYAASAIGRAFDAGDRAGLESDSSRKAAELVRDLATMCVDSSSPLVCGDVGHAMRHLLDEMACVRFANTPASDFRDEKTLPVLGKATDECFSVPGFTTWPAPSMRRRYVLCLRRSERTQLAYTLLSLAFDYGSCPLLSLSDRRVLRMQSMKASSMLADSPTKWSIMAFFANALSAMRTAKEEGRNNLGLRMTAQELVESVCQHPVNQSNKSNPKKEQEK